MPRPFGVVRPYRIAWLGLWCTLVSAAAAAEPVRVVVFAAASTTEAVSTLAARFAAKTGARIVPSFAASSVLARQIESGAPADLFISADRRWIDHLVARNLIDTASRCELARNRLVLIAPSESPIALRIAPGFALAAALDGGRLALGNPDHVPAGMYARQALMNLGAWPAVENRLVPSADVRAALALVARGEAALGVVYATDAAVSERVRIVDAFPTTSHDPIVYPVARVAGADNPVAAAFFAFLRSAAGREVLARFGFETDGGLSCSP